ncbi:MAG: hypothetical protein IAA31_03555 [Candidatus Anaerobiospirillum merdipullorum]|uniref:ApeI dehydratase-like domain-containing protein n=1 Tax=Candidatus Anaerobiospirillum merdipullorum TaxID=2838450 RepID=A0A9E2NRW8_9GAMM|nr:hypothetical protein [Candidatus Anaerobiospirillum merdipullorum]
MSTLLPKDFALLSCSKDSLQAQCTLSPSLPWFKGHFPHCPILPGVAELYLLDAAVKLGWGEQCHLAGFSQLKFFCPLSPGARVRLEVSALKASRWRFALYSGATEQLCAKGEFTLC